MSDIIQLLPDSVANQIAAGEVIQRPASVVKELVENALDAKATDIKILVKDAGKTLIRVIDNGLGMSETDARLAFERHATSKIRKATDLFAIKTMGFRGEALASIAAIADVELKTKQKQTELGTLINISASELKEQEPINCANGSSFSVKNLFFNIPARRKFLKSNSTELRHIIDEVQRIALTNNKISISLFHNNSEIYSLSESNKHQRIINIFKANKNYKLISVNTKTTLINIEGFVGKPENAKKTSGEQYFFVNNRYMRHPYFYKAVVSAYENIITRGLYPSFFLYLTVDPSQIDINIHPTKTEIKFESERDIWQIINAGIRESLGKFNIVPSIDFEKPNFVDIPSPTKHNNNYSPRISINPDFNPFDNIKRGDKTQKDNIENWDSLYSGIDEIESTNKVPEQQLIFDESVQQNWFLQLKGKYIMTPVKSGVMIINQKFAHERILFEEFSQNIISDKYVSQKLIFPVIIEFSSSDYEILNKLDETIYKLGFRIKELEKNKIEIDGVPSGLTETNTKDTIESLIEDYKEKATNITDEIKQNIVLKMAKCASINYGKQLNTQDMQTIFDNLFSCSAPNYTVEGKKIISILKQEEIDKLFDA